MGHFFYDFFMNTYLKRNHYKILNMNTLNKDLRRTVSYQKEWGNSECWNLSLKYSKFSLRYIDFLSSIFDPSPVKIKIDFPFL